MKSGAFWRRALKETKEQISSHAGIPLAAGNLRGVYAYKWRSKSRSAIKSICFKHWQRVETYEDLPGKKPFGQFTRPERLAFFWPHTTLQFFFDFAVVYVDEMGPEEDKKSFTRKLFGKWGPRNPGADPLHTGERILCTNCREGALRSACTHAYSVYILRQGSVAMRGKKNREDHQWPRRGSGLWETDKRRKRDAAATRQTPTRQISAHLR